MNKTKIEIDAPWGNFKFTGMLGFIEQTIEQLNHFKKSGNNFLAIKQDAIMPGKRFIVVANTN